MDSLGRLKVGRWGLTRGPKRTLRWQIVLRRGAVCVRFTM
jgi:hypothetical protein